MGYHRNDAGSGEVSTPTLDRIAQDGLRLERLYVHKICSPTRCALQSGRAPVHVNTQNVLPEVDGEIDWEKLMTVDGKLPDVQSPP